MIWQPDELSIRDWALIWPSKDREIGSNKIPDNARGHVYYSELTAFSKSLPKHGDEIAKVGQATGFTVGHYNGLRSVQIATHMENGKEIRIITHEHCFVGCDKIYSLTEAGDSGSLVFERDTGLVVGMLFGGSESYDIGYFQDRKTTTINTMAMATTAVFNSRDLLLQPPPISTSAPATQRVTPYTAFILLEFYNHGQTFTSIIDLVTHIEEVTGAKEVRLQE